MTSADDILNFWFGELAADGWAREDRRKMWFGGGRALDADIRRRFAAAHRRAAAGELDAWGNTPRGALALILLLDQFSRHLGRGRAAAFAHDARALAVCEQGLARRLHRRLPQGCRVFYYLPLEHSEDLTRQKKSVNLYRRLAQECPPARHEEAVGALRYAEKHRDLIARFGRFPHRNEILGRKSRPEEAAYLREDGERFGQRRAPAAARVRMRKK